MRWESVCHESCRLVTFGFPWEPVKVHSESEPYSPILALMCRREKFEMETSLESVQNRASPSFLPTRSSSNKPSNPIFILRFCSLTCFIFISIRNKNLGLFSFAKRRRSRTTRGFPSPWQFQLMHASYFVIHLLDPPPTAPDLSSQAEPDE